MAMITCDCGRQFSNLRHKECPSCGKPASGGPVDLAKPKRKGVFASKTKEELNDREITPIGELRFRQSMAGLIIVSVFVMLGSCIANIKWPEPVSKEAETCRLAADLHARAGGAKTYRFAEAVSATRAELNFSNKGVWWTTNYFCD